MKRALLLLALAGLLIGSSAQVTPEPPTTFEQELGVSILMRDGVRLAGDVFRPHGTKRLPTVLIRTPYNRKNMSNLGYRVYVRRGYALVIEDVRGRFASQGTFGSIVQEGPDASDTVDWIAAQAWSDGRVAMTGSSYLGIAQWWAAVQDNPHLVGIAPMNSGDDEYLDRFYSVGGALKFGHRLLWLAQNFHSPGQVPPPFYSYAYHLPERSADVAATGRELPIWRDALAHPSYDAWWDQFSIRQQLDRVKIPVMSASGWFDNYAESELDAFTHLARRGNHVETWIGPWAHDPGVHFKTRDFGPNGVSHMRMTAADWIQELFDRPASMHSAEAKLHLFIMGPDVWREEREWPLKRTVFTSLYLGEDGQLGTHRPDNKKGSDSFTYDPRNPVPTTGGAICCDPRTFPPGPLEQSAVEKRPDVLVYSTAPLTEAVEATGPVRANLFVSTSANDTDFTAKLVDVGPDGRALLVCDGIQRMRYRLTLAKPYFVKRNTRYEIDVDAGVTAWVFKPGHRIRLEISSSNFPRFDRNLNTTRPIADETKVTKAKQTVYRSAQYPSALILPLIPRGRSSGSGQMSSNVIRMQGR